MMISIDFWSRIQDFLLHIIKITGSTHPCHDIFVLNFFLTLTATQPSVKDESNVPFRISLVQNLQALITFYEKISSDS